MANVAVIKLAGSQHVVRPGDKLEVNRLTNDLDTSFNPEVLLSTEKDAVLFNEGKVEAKVLEHKKGEKLFVVKFKAKSRYRKRTGHRQHLTLIEVVSVNGEKKEAKKVEVKEEAVVEAPVVAEAKPKKATAKKTTKKAE